MTLYVLQPVATELEVHEAARTRSWELDNAS